MDKNSQFPFDISSLQKIFGNTRSISEFERQVTLGEGTYGTVYSAKDKVSGEIVAIKKVKIHDEKEGFPITSLREVKLLNETKEHINIVKLKEVAVGSKDDSIFLVFEHRSIDLGCLSDSMRLDGEKMSVGEVKCIMLQILNAMSYLHQKMIMHRDLKLTNILIGKDGIVKLADFGLARKYEKPSCIYTPNVVTLWYRAPEILLGCNNYDQKADIWSLGCILAEFLNQGIPLFQGKNEIHQFLSVCEIIGYPNKEEISILSSSESKGFLKYGLEFRKNLLNEKFGKFGKTCVDLIYSMLRWDPAKRISVNEAIVHPFFYEDPRSVNPEDMKFLRKLDNYSKDLFDQMQAKKKVKK